MSDIFYYIKMNLYTTYWCYKIQKLLKPYQYVEESYYDSREGHYELTVTMHPGTDNAYSVHSANLKPLYYLLVERLLNDKLQNAY